MDAGVAVSVRNVQLAIRSNRQPRGSVEWTRAALDRRKIGAALRRIARVARLIQRPEQPQQLAVERERAHRMVRIVGAIDDILVDGDAVWTGEDAFAPGTDELTVRGVDDDRVIAAIKDIDAITRVSGDTRHVAMRPT